ncbi:MAG: DUF6932 family protein [Fimbriiglobus sp.]
MLPDFTADDLLPPGDYPLTFEQVRQSILVLGSQSRPNWDTAWRLNLVGNLEVMVGQLWQVGINEIFVDGSFAEAKSRPNDIDGYFVCDSKRLYTGQLQNELNQLDPYQIWTWDSASRTAFKGYPKKQLPMWHQYRVELFPHYGQLCGIQDQHGNPLEFPAAFRLSRSGEPKGIIQIVR